MSHKPINFGIKNITPEEKKAAFDMYDAGKDKFYIYKTLITVRKKERKERVLILREKKRLQHEAFMLRKAVAAERMMQKTIRIEKNKIRYAEQRRIREEKHIAYVARVAEQKRLKEERQKLIEQRRAERRARPIVIKDKKKEDKITYIKTNAGLSDKMMELKYKWICIERDLKEQEKKEWQQPKKKSIKKPKHS